MTGKRRPIILYQPRDAGAVMPLGLLALGSWLSGEHVVVVDGRFELAPEARVAELAREALCLGVSVRTGAPLREARRVSAAARAARPGLPVLWGGAHASLDPASCLETGVVDACAPGAGEEALAAAAEAIRGGHPLPSVPGLVTAEGVPAEDAPPPSTLWPRADYALLDVERHFELRGQRRLDYCSSRGARDGTAWMALRAERVVAEARELAERHRLAEVLFQDWDFFADPERVEAIAVGLLEGGGRLGWQAGARPEDVLASPPARLRLLAESGCRRLHFGVRAGTAPRELLLEAGTRLGAAGLGARFVFDVPPPAIAPSGLAEAVSAARSLSALDGRFETPMRRAWASAPVPGPHAGGTLEGWAAGEAPPWPDAGAERRLARAAFFFAEAQRAPGSRVGQHVLRLLALLRVRLGFFALDAERVVVEIADLLRTGRRRRVAPAE
ncbi:MAG TPA: radical SAM protein [Vicinamibacteria bacterium]